MNCLIKFHLLLILLMNIISLPSYYTQSLNFRDSLKNVYHSSSNPFEKFNALNLFNEDYFNSGTGSIDSTSCEQMLQISRELKSDSLLAISYNWIGNFFYWKSDENTALEYFLKGVRLAESVGDKRRICSFYIDISRIYRNVGNLNRQENAMLLAKNNLPDSNSKNYYLLLAQIDVEYFVIYHGNGKLDSAEYYAHRVRSSSLKLNSNVFKIVSMSIFGMLYSAKKLNKQATEQFVKAIHFSDSINYYWGLQFSLNNYSEFLLSQNRKNEAKKFALRAFNYNSLVRSSLESLRSINLLDKIYSSLNLLDSAIYYAHLNLELRDSVFNIDKLNKIQTMAFSEQLKYETEKKEKEITALHLQNEINRIKIGNQRKNNIILIGSVIILIAFLFSLFRLFKKTKYQKNIIQKSLLEKEVLLREIHHRVKNNLQFISSLLNLQSKHLHDEKALSALKEGQNRVKSMALIHQNLYLEENLVGVDCKIYFESLIKSLFNSYNITDERIRLKLDIEPVKLNLDIMIPLGLIVNELISNSLKYAFPNEREGIIKISIQELNEKLQLLVEDNGQGMISNDKGEFKKGFGYRLIQMLIAQLEASINIKNESGTMIEIELRKYKSA